MRSACPATSQAAEEVEIGSAQAVAPAAPFGARSPASVLSLQRTAENAAAVFDKLELNIETLRELSRDELGNVAGGAGTVTMACQTTTGPV